MNVTYQIVAKNAERHTETPFTDSQIATSTQQSESTVEQPRATRLIDAPPNPSLLLHPVNHRGRSPMRPEKPSVEPRGTPLTDAQRAHIAALDNIDLQAVGVLSKIDIAQSAAKTARIGEAIQSGRTGLDSIFGTQRGPLGTVFDSLATIATSAQTNAARQKILEVKRSLENLNSAVYQNRAALMPVGVGPNAIRGSDFRLTGIIFRNTNDVGFNSMASAVEAINSASHAAELGQAVRQLAELRSRISMLRTDIQREKQRTLSN